MLRSHVAIIAALVVPPPLGAWLADRPLGHLLALPPRPIPVEHPGFDPAVFAALLVPVAAMVLALVVPLARARERRDTGSRRARHRWPWWGTIGAIMLFVAWYLAWTRHAWMAPLQLHTFTPIWLGYIIVVNAATYRRTGRCRLVDRPSSFGALFAASAVFWWFFEYLNRFVGNWHYVEVESFTSIEYTVLATCAFATVLPAVIGTIEFLLTFGLLARAYARGPAFDPACAKLLPGTVLAISLVALLGIGIWPSLLFPFVWIAPMLVIVAIHALAGRTHGLEPLAAGDWTCVAVPAIASLWCGLLWEMWNSHSLAGWTYTVPYVSRFHLFEMPALGYGGYLPFGVECVVALGLLPRALRPQPFSRIGDGMGDLGDMGGGSLT